MDASWTISEIYRPSCSACRQVLLFLSQCPGWFMELMQPEDTTETIDGSESHWIEVRAENVLGMVKAVLCVIAALVLTIVIGNLG